MTILSNLKNKKGEVFKKENIYFFIIIFTIFFLDRITKIKILSNFGESVYFVNNYLNFDLIWNIGIGFGIMSTSSSVIYNLITFTIGFVILFLLYIFLISKKLEKISYSIIIGGALGNFYDRLVFNAVPDFIDIHYNNFHWFTFNVADIFISIGILFFILSNWFVKN